MSTALFKNLNVNRIISRAINPLHEYVLQALGIEEIVHPEEESADRWAKNLSLKEVVDSFELSDQFSIIEAKVPDEYVGKSLEEVGFRKTYNIILLTTIKKREVKSLLGKTKTESTVQGVATPDLVLEENDILVLYGANTDLQKFLKLKNMV
jgi:trk system potassium uptake protein TrkA